MLGERAYSAQETAHLLLGIPLVRTSVSFQNLNLSRNGSLRALEDRRNEEPGEPQGAAEDDGDNRTVTGQSWLQRSVHC